MQLLQKNSFDFKSEHKKNLHVADTFCTGLYAPAMLLCISADHWNMSGTVNGPSQSAYLLAMLPIT